MTQEIVFTSAREGLRTGSTGFCTVRSTRGMPGNLAQLLERLTGYSHAFDAYGNQAILNPVNFSHYVVRVGDQHFHLLARVSNAPLDHTNRSNKLAHLLAVESSRLNTGLSEGPAAESLKISWVREWDSDAKPYVLPDEKQIVISTSDQQTVGPCNLWKEATGDAGWAAVLAASADEGTTPMQVILPRDVGSRRETWALELVHEALSLIPPAQRWDVSYSTFFAGNLPVSVKCRWQFVLDGTDSAKRARVDPRGRAIDIPSILAEKRPPPQISLTEFTAVAARPWETAAVATSVAKRRPPNKSRRLTSSDSNVPSSEEHAEAENDLSTQPDAKLPRSRRKKKTSDKKSQHGSTPLFLHPVSLMMGGILVAGVAFLIVRAGQPEASSTFDEIVATSKVETNLHETKKRKKQQREEEQQQRILDEERRKREAAKEQMRLAMSGNSPGEVAVPPPKAAPESKPDQPDTPRVVGPPPLEDVRKKNNRLQLTVPQPGLNAPSVRRIELATVHVTALENFELKRIIGGHSVLKSGIVYSLTPKTRNDDPFREWEVIRKVVSGVGLGSAPDVVGRFRLDEESIFSFRWDRKNSGYEIVNCLLEMEANEPGRKKELEKCTLREVKRIKPIEFDQKANKEVQLISLLSPTELADTDDLEFQCDFINLPKPVTRKGATKLRVGHSVDFEMQKASTAKYPRSATINVALVKAPQGVCIAMKMTLKMPVVDEATGHLKVMEVPFKASRMDKSDANIKEFSREIENHREGLNRAQVALENLRKDAPNHLNKNGMPTEAFKKMLQDQQNLVNAQKDDVKKRDAEFIELDSLATDLKKFLGKIFMNGRLQFSLRLMIPDADGGIELVATDESQR